MAYVQKTWQNRQSEYSNRRQLTQVSANVYDVSRAEGVVAIDGDPFDAATMNNLETRIASGFSDAASALNGKEAIIPTGTTAQYLRGNKTWAEFAASVRTSALTGLSTATNAAIAATDTVLAALGKLQAQVNVKANLASPAFTGTATVAPGTDYVTSKLRNTRFNTTDLTAGTSVLANGEVYAVYE